jgi:SSS family solute:Na+ symporter
LTMMNPSALRPWDWIALVGYFAVVLAIGWHFARKGKDPLGYFLAGRRMAWLPVGASLFISNISTEHVVGLAGAGARSGLAVGQFEWLACPILLLLGWCLAPVYLRLGLYTMPEYLERRYGRRPAILVSLVTVLAYVLTKISVHLYAASLILSPILGWNPLVTSALLVLLTGAYTAAGGLGAVIYADLFQSLILLAAGTTVTCLGLSQVGGFSTLHALLPKDFFHMWKPASDQDYPWPGIVLGAPILGFWYWCTDQSIVQRVLAARDEGHARAGAILAGFLKLLPVFLFVFPGMLARALYPSELQGSSPLGNKADLAYLLLLRRLLPPGLLGLSLAGMLAALMGAMSAVFNSTSTLLTMDFYRKLKPEASEKKLLLVGRWSTVLTVIFGVLWSPLVPLLGGGLFLYLQSMQAYLSPPIAACFLWGILSPKPTERGAFSCLGVGLAAGLLRIGLEAFDRFHRLGNPLFRNFVDLHFLYYAAAVFLLCSGILWAKSRAKEGNFPVDSERAPLLARMGPLFAGQEGKGRVPVTHVFASATLLLVLACLWIYFG